MISSEFTELKQNCECQNSTCFFLASHLHVSERSQNGFVACHIFSNTNQVIVITVIHFICVTKYFPRFPLALFYLSSFNHRMLPNSVKSNHYILLIKKIFEKENFQSCSLKTSPNKFFITHRINLLIQIFTRMGLLLNL